MHREAAKGSTVPEPLVITISHRLGRDEAKRRLDDGLGHIRGQLAGFVSSLDYTWTGYRLDFSVTAMRQSIDGRIDIEDDIGIATSFVSSARGGPLGVVD